MTTSVLTKPSLDLPPARYFTYKHDYPRPTLPSSDWTLIRVKAALLGHAELRGRAAFPPWLGELNIFQKEYHKDPPALLGEELVGIVEEAGSSSGFVKGENVTWFI
jgi:NADPH2:quinone reductase